MVAGNSRPLRIALLQGLTSLPMQVPGSSWSGWIVPGQGPLAWGNRQPHRGCIRMHPDATNASEKTSKFYLHRPHRL